LIDSSDEAAVNRVGFVVARVEIALRAAVRVRNYLATPGVPDESDRFPFCVCESFIPSQKITRACTLDNFPAFTPFSDAQAVIRTFIREPSGA
jgi:hypothetical protein